ncbi:MAG: arginine decarboxylase, pyruvoyl-dependent [Fibrobacterota bacterium]
MIPEQLIAQKVFLTRGVGVHKRKLASFEMALRNAQIEDFNLVRVSSIYPPKAQLISRTEGLRYLKPGQIVFCVMSDVATDEPARRIAASVGIARPVDRTRYGYLSEHHSFGETGKQAGDFAEDLAAEMLGSTMGLDINVDKAWDEKRGIYRFPKNIIKTQNITATATGDKKGLWTTCVAACIFILGADINQTAPAGEA